MRKLRMGPYVTSVFDTTRTQPGHDAARKAFRSEKMHHERDHKGDDAKYLWLRMRQTLAPID